MQILVSYRYGMSDETFAKLEKRYNVFSFMDEFSLSSMLQKLSTEDQEVVRKIQFNLTNVSRIVWYSQQKNGVYVLLSCAVPGGWCYTESNYPPNILSPQIKFDTGKVHRLSVPRDLEKKVHRLSVPRDLEKIASDVSVDKTFLEQYKHNKKHFDRVFEKEGLEKDTKFLMHWNYKSATVGWDEWKEVINTEAFKRENKATLTYYIGGLRKTETVEVRELVQRKKGGRKGEEMEEDKHDGENTGGEEDKGEEEKEEKRREEEEKQREVQQCFDGFSGSSSGYRTAKEDEEAVSTTQSDEEED